MDELKFIQAYMAVMGCSEQSAVGVFIVHDALVEPEPSTWLDGLAAVPMAGGIEAPRAGT
jgi:hypothetical protein